jgi:hypothetical protein
MLILAAGEAKKLTLRHDEGYLSCGKYLFLEAGQQQPTRSHRHAFGPE